MGIFIGLDPGTRSSGLAVVDTNIVSVQTFDLENTEIITVIEEFLCGNPTAIVGYEWLQSYGNNIGESVLRSAHMCGRMDQVARAHGVKVHEQTKPTINRHFCTRNNVPKSEVRKALLQRFGGNMATKKGGTLHGISNHKWDALAVCIYICEVYYDYAETHWCAGGF